jgi:hypothetical protein
MTMSFVWAISTWRSECARLDGRVGQKAIKRVEHSSSGPSSNSKPHLQHHKVTSKPTHPITTTSNSKHALRKDPLHYPPRLRYHGLRGPRRRNNSSRRDSHDSYLGPVSILHACGSGSTLTHELAATEATTASVRTASASAGGSARRTATATAGTRSSMSRCFVRCLMRAYC